MFGRNDMFYSDSASFNLHYFKPLRTNWFALTHLIITFSMGTTMLTTLIWNSVQVNKTQYYLICQAAFWLLSFIFYLKYVSQHHYLKLGGYFVYYKKIQKISLALFIIPSFFSSLLVCVIGILSEIYSLNSTIFGGNNELELRYFVTAVILLELFLETCMLLVYLFSVKKFNQLKPVPDVDQYEYLIPCDARSSSEIGYRLEGEAVADLLEKQADLLCYFKSTITDLKSKLSEVTNINCILSTGRH